MDTAGLGGWDVLGAYRLGVEFPCVVRGEGVGRTGDGRRVYFGERSVQPFGAWAERTLVPADEVWDVPDDVDDKTAISMGIAATGAIVPLERAWIQHGENVLILGATGRSGRSRCSSRAASARDGWSARLDRRRRSSGCNHAASPMPSCRSAAATMWRR